jgi:hypothetical protein
MSYLHKRLSELEGEELREAVLERFKDDYDFRYESLGRDGGFEECDRLFEARSTDHDDDETVPRVNLIRRAVEDYLSVALSNIPRAKLYAQRHLPATLPEWERDLRLEILSTAESVINAYVKTIMKDNEYNDLVQLAVSQSAIFGVGYLRIAVDRSLDIAESMELRDLLAKAELSPEDMDRLEVLKNRVDICHIDTRDVYWEAGKRRAIGKGDDVAQRVSYVERVSTLTLREEYEDAVEAPELIRPGKFPFEIHEELPDHRDRDDTQTAVLTMWELEPVEKARVITGPDGEEVEIAYTDRLLVKVVIAGGELVEKEVYTGIPADDEDYEAGPLRLPIVPFYLRESVNHPYGYSIPLMLSLSEKFINAMRAIIYRSARKAVSTQGVVVAIPNLGDGDLEELEYVLEEGGVARLKGNTQGPFDIKDVVMPLNYNAAPINPAMLQSMNMEMDMFRRQSQQVDVEELASARSGAAKRAQVAAADRPKSISISMLAKSVEACYMAVYELIKIYHTPMIGVAVEIPGGGREYVILNEPYRANILVEDDNAASPENPYGFMLQPFEATLNSVNVPMYAEAEGRGALPLDMIARFQILIALQQAQIIEPETVRDLALDEEIKDMDDVARRRREAQQAAMQQAMMMTQMMGDPNTLNAQANSLGPLAGLAPTMGEVSQDAQQATGMGLPVQQIS